MSFFYVIGNYSVMFLLYKNAPRRCDQIHEYAREVAGGKFAVCCINFRQKLEVTAD